MWVNVRVTVFVLVFLALVWLSLGYGYSGDKLLGILQLSIVFFVVLWDML